MISKSRNVEVFSNRYWHSSSLLCILTPSFADSHGGATNKRGNMSRKVSSRADLEAAWPIIKDLYVGKDYTLSEVVENMEERGLLTK